MPANPAGNHRAVERLQAAAPGVLLALLLLLAFHGALVGRRFYLRDVSQNHAPLRAHVTERLSAGALPLWDPYHGGGTPLMANPNALVLHPITALFFLLPLDAAFTASIVLQFVLLATGGYLLARALDRGRGASVMAAAVMALSGPAASLASMQNVLSAAAWVPIALWAYLRGLEPGRRWLLAPASLCAAVVLTAAEPASILALLLTGIVLGTTSRPPGGRIPAPAAALGALALVVALGALLAAAQIIPAGALLPIAERGGGFAAAEGLKWSLLPSRLPEAVLPQLFGDPTRLSPAAWWGGFLFEGRYPFLLSLYVGAIPAVLAAIGVLHRGAAGARRRALCAVAAGALLLALGGNTGVYRVLFDAVFPLRQVRYPERFVIAALPALALLAAYGLDRLRSGPLSRRGALATVVAAAAAFALAAAAATAPLADRMLMALARIPAPFLGSEPASFVRGGLLRSALWAFCEAALVAAAAAFLRWRHGASTARAACWGLVAVSGLSMILASAPARSTAAPGWLSAPSPLAGVVERGASAPRLHHAPRPPELSVWAKTDELVWGYRYDRFVYALLTGHPEHVPSVLEAATDRMDLKESPALGRAIGDLPVAARVRALAACRVGLLLSYDSIEDGGLEAGPVLEGFSRPPLRTYRVRSVVPRVRWVGRARRMPADRNLAGALSDPGYDPRREVLVEGPLAEAGGAAPPPVDTGEATVIEETPERLRIAVRAPAAGFVVVADAFAPGWRATLNGRDVPILRADGLFRAVAVGPGEQALEMVYRPPEVPAGFAASFAGLLLAAAWGFVAKVKKL